MRSERRTRLAFVGIAFGWSYLFWGIGISLAVTRDVTIPESVDLLRSVLDSSLETDLIAIAVVNTVAGYGPLLAALVTCLLIPRVRDHLAHRFSRAISARHVMQILALFLLITMVPAVPYLVGGGPTTTLSWSLAGLLLLFFVYQLLTASTEEIGWRGVLLPSLLQQRTPWRASVDIGVIWALWHTPIVLYVFAAQGLLLWQIVLSFGGFVAGTIAMSVVHTFYYLKTKNLLFNMLLHAVANTLPMFVGVLVSQSYEISVGVQVLLWGFVFYLTRRHRTLFDTVATVTV